MDTLGYPTASNHRITFFGCVFVHSNVNKAINVPDTMIIYCIAEQWNLREGGSSEP